METMSTLTVTGNRIFDSTNLINLFVDDILCFINTIGRGTHSNTE